MMADRLFITGQTGRGIRMPQLRRDKDGGLRPRQFLEALLIAWHFPASFVRHQASTPT